MLFCIPVDEASKSTIVKKLLIPLLRRQLILTHHQQRAVVDTIVDSFIFKESRWEINATRPT